MNNTRRYRKTESARHVRSSKWLAATAKSWNATAKKWRRASHQRASIGGPSADQMRAKSETLELCARELEMKRSKTAKPCPVAHGPVEFHVKSYEWKKMPAKTKSALAEMVKCATETVRKRDCKANFLWPHKEGSVQQAGYEFANGNTEAYRKVWWRILLLRARTPNAAPSHAATTQEEQHG